MFQFIVLLFGIWVAARASVVDTVNPFIGTAVSDSGPASGTPGGGQGGATTPSAVAPFGLIQWGPDTDAPETSGYNYSNHRIRDFSLTHMSGPGCANSADLPILPFSGAPSWRPVAFDHVDETASPGRYGVRLANGISVNLASSERSGMARFVFAGRGSHGLMLDTTWNGAGATTGQIQFLDDRHLWGHVNGGNFCGSGNRYVLHFSIEFDRPAIRRSWTNGMATLTFSQADGAILKMKVGLSYVSDQNARSNLESEIPGWDWDQLADQTAQKWEGLLNRVQFGQSTLSTSTRSVFYTALYHSLLHPNVLSDGNGDYLGFDGNVHSLSGGHRFYGNFSGWDIYRSQVQLLALLVPSTASDIAQSLVASGQQCGALPKWAQVNSDTGIMPGDPGPLILANFYAFGARDFDVQTALKLMQKNAFDPTAACNSHLIRYGADDYLRLGFVPESNVDQLSASITLEYNSADFAIAQLARSLGQQKLFDVLSLRSSSWLNLWDATTQHVRPKLATGRWLTPFVFGSGLGFTEGNSEQYSWLVPFDLSGVVKRMGGDGPTRARLDQFFSQLNVGQESPHLYIGNEPAFGTPWVYLWAHEPSGASDVIRRILAQNFSNAPGGLPGNDDLGAISSWYVWATLGLFPEVPGVGGLAVNGPAVAEIHVLMENGQELNLVAPKSESQPYVSSMSLNGMDRRQTWVLWSEIKDGAKIEFVTSARPTDWGTRDGDEPPSFPAAQSELKSEL